MSLPRTMTIIFAYILALHFCDCANAQTSHPNFIFLLTDDQDLVFGSMDYMPNTLQYIAKTGITFNNAFIATPICCPSRTETITGRYYHNIRQEGEIDCMDIAAKYNIFNNTASMFQLFHKNGYLTGSFGKLTNNMPAFWCNENPIFDGFDRVHCPCDISNFYGLQYMDKYMNGSVWLREENLTADVYQTSMIGNATLLWLNDIIPLKKPFIAWIAPHAPHFPATPAEWYANRFPNATVPQTPNFNLHVYDHHSYVSTNPELNATAIAWIDQLWRDRLRSLLSVDDLVFDIFQFLQLNDMLHNTYVVFSSDHGYHLGNMRVPCSKQSLYESDLRIPMFISGPNISANVSSDMVVSNVDILPTFLQLAGIQFDMNAYDGQSWIPYILENKNMNDSKRSDSELFSRDIIISQYISGETADFAHCKTWWPSETGAIPGLVLQPPGANADDEEWMIDISSTNTWRALRILNASLDATYAEFVTPDQFNNKSFDDPWFYEYYDNALDPHQIHNLYGNLSEEVKTEMHSMLMYFGSCQGRNCSTFKTLVKT